MSFTATVKSEIITVNQIKIEKITELSAIIRNSAEYKDTIKISTENSSTARFIYKTIKDLYGVEISITVRRGYNFHKNYIYILDIKREKSRILTDLGLIKDHTYQSIPSSFIVDDPDLINAYLRGLFLSVGSISDPKTARYHLEFLVDKEEYADFIITLLNQFGLNSKKIKRDIKYMVYIKEAEKISDFLRIVKAMNAVLYFENIRIYRDQKNMTNRLNNCEQANVDKVIETSSKQIRDIEFLKEMGSFDLLDDKIKEMVEYRIKYPETSLIELSEIITMETGHSITKSGLHHRFKKLEEMAKKIRSQI